MDNSVTQTVLGVLCTQTHARDRTYPFPITNILRSKPLSSTQIKECHFNGCNVVPVAQEDDFEVREQTQAPTLARVEVHMLTHSCAYARTHPRIKRGGTGSKRATRKLTWIPREVKIPTRVCVRKKSHFGSRLTTTTKLMMFYAYHLVIRAHQHV